MIKKYTHLFFDLDNTLWDFKTNSRYAMKVVFKNFIADNQEIDFNSFFEIYSINNEILWGYYRKKQIQKKELTRQRFQLTFDKLGINGINPEEMNASYLTEMPKQSYLVDGAINVLEYAKSKGYKMNIITNGFKEVQHNKLKSSGLAPYFNKVFISEEVKTPKPGHEIFEYAIKSTNAKKKQSLMIGDDWDVDIIGALKFGIDAVFYSAGKSKRNEIGEVADMNCELYKVEVMRDLVSLL